MTSRVVDVAVVGAGVIGLSVAWRAAQEGLTVAICDPEPARGASWAAAGMLAPTTEGRWGEGTLQALSQASADRVAGLTPPPWRRTAAYPWGCEGTAPSASPSMPMTTARWRSPSRSSANWVATSSCSQGRIAGGWSRPSTLG